GSKPFESSSHQVGGDAFMFTIFSDEYDPRSSEAKSRRDFLNRLHKDFRGRYTVKVGDVWYALIGQVEDRKLYAVRYQAIGGRVVTSRVEAPVLAEEVMNDWRNADAEALKTSLMVDIHAAAAASEPDASARYRANGALERLRLYFPNTYDALQGD